VVGETIDFRVDGAIKFGGTSSFCVTFWKWLDLMLAEMPLTKMLLLGNNFSEIFVTTTRSYSGRTVDQRGQASALQKIAVLIHGTAARVWIDGNVGILL
jgi:hypothetical protein